jgi:hypothetical protein
MDNSPMDNRSSADLVSVTELQRQLSRLRCSERSRQARSQQEIAKVGILK